MEYPITLKREKRSAEREKSVTRGAGKIISASDNAVHYGISFGATRCSRNCSPFGANGQSDCSPGVQASKYGQVCLLGCSGFGLPVGVQEAQRFPGQQKASRV